MKNVIKFLEKRENEYRQLKIDYSINGPNKLSDKCKSLEYEYANAIKILKETDKPKNNIAPRPKLP